MYKEARQLLSSEREDERCAGIEIISANVEDSGIELLAMQLENERSTFVRRRLIAALGATNSPYTAKVAGRLLASSEAYVRNAALAIMQMLGSVALPKLAILINHQDCDLRKQAADALSKVAGDEACLLLITGLNDTDPNVVSACAEALGKRSDLRIIPALTTALGTTEEVWVAFAIIESLANIGDQKVLAIIEQYVHKKSWSHQQNITLVGIWAVAIGKIGDEQQLAQVWSLYDDKILTSGQVFKLLDSFQERGINLQFQQLTIEKMLKGFFEINLNTNFADDIITAIHIASHNCPLLLADYLSTIVDKFATNEIVMQEVISAVKLANQLLPDVWRGAGMYKLLAYMYDNDPYLEHRYFILNSQEIFQNDHYEQTWEWLVDNLTEADSLFQRAAIRGMQQMGTLGERYLNKMLESTLDCDRELAMLIRQELEYERRLDQ